MLNKDWTKKIKKLFSSKGSDPMKMEFTPYRDWRIVAMSFFAGLVVSLGFNIYMSIEINRDNFFTATAKSGEEVTLNKEGLEKVLADFAGKEATFEKVKTEGVSVVDPSL